MISIILAADCMQIMSIMSQNAGKSQLFVRPLHQQSPNILLAGSQIDTLFALVLTLALLRAAKHAFHISKAACASAAVHCGTYSLVSAPELPSCSAINSAAQQSRMYTHNQLSRTDASVAFTGAAQLGQHGTMPLQVKTENPGIAFTDVAKVLGDKWKSVSAEDKKPYEEQAAEDKKRYEEQMAAYKASKAEAAVSD